VPLLLLRPLLSLAARLRGSCVFREQGREGEREREREREREKVLRARAMGGACFRAFGSRDGCRRAGVGPVRGGGFARN
jgi:hypothetical protein